MTRFVPILFIVLIFSIASCTQEDDNGNLQTFDPNFFLDGEIEFITSEPDPSKITLFYIGDGFLKEDLSKNSGAYREAGLAYFEHIFFLEPFATYRDHFNAAIIYTESEESSIRPEGHVNNTALGVHTIGENLYRADASRLQSYINRVPNEFLDRYNILVAINGVSGGNAFRTLNEELNYNGNIAYAGSNSLRVMAHELGHSLGLLGDEYATINGIHPDFSIVQYFANLDKPPNMEGTKWSHFFEIPGYENQRLWRGGDNYAYGLWRPTEFSVMNSLTTEIESNFFNAVSREALVKAIYGLRNIPYSFEEFLANDNANGTNRIFQEKFTIQSNCSGIHLE